MKIISFLIAFVLIISVFGFVGFAAAQTSQTQASLTQQLIQLLTQMIAQLEQEIQQILAMQKNSNPVPVPTTCTPNWQCGWSDCVHGSQSETIVDSNNCGLPASGAGIACPALARLCAVCTKDSDCPQLGVTCSANSCPVNKCVNGQCKIENTIAPTASHCASVDGNAYNQCNIDSDCVGVAQPGSPAAVNKSKVADFNAAVEQAWQLNNNIPGCQGVSIVSQNPDLFNYSCVNSKCSATPK